MQTQLLPLGNLVDMAQGRDVEMVLVDGEIVVEDACPLKVDRMPSDATQTPRSARAGRGRAPARHTPVASQSAPLVITIRCESVSALHGSGAPEVP